LTNCATSRKVAGSITDGIIGIFHIHYGSRIHSASNRSTRIISSTSWSPKGLSRPVQGGFYLYIPNIKASLANCFGGSVRDDAVQTSELLFFMTLTLDPITNQLNPKNTRHYFYFQIHFNIITSRASGSPKGVFVSD
jgi:hypothetical protein